MRPVYQTMLGSPDGNCLAACIASLLEVPIEGLPNPKQSGWFTQWNVWLTAQHGVYLVRLPAGFADDMSPLQGYYIANGLAARGLRHSVVYRDGRLCHDPHPEGRGLDEVDDYMVLVPLGPAE